MRKGYIYVLQNPAFRSNLVKIGMTTRSVDERVKELSANTSVPSPFEVACFFSVNNCDIIESIVHNRLDSYRWSKNREFFDLPLQIVYKVISEIILEHQESTVVQQIFLDSPLNTNSNSESYNTEIKNADLLIKLEELKEKNRITEKNLGERWVKNYLKIKNIILPRINQFLLQTNIDKNLEISLINAKKVLESYMTQKEYIFYFREDLKTLMRELES